MYVRILGIFCLLTIISFSSFAEEGVNIKPRALGKDFKSFHSENEDKEFTTPQDYDEPTGVITLSQALALSLIRNPQLRAFSWEVRAREAQTLQAGLPPNPEISFELEDFGGTGSVEGFDGIETTILLSQLIPLGGKLSKKKKIENLNTDLAEWDYETVRLNVLTKTALYFLNVLASQERYTLELELVYLAERVHTTVSERAQAGEISPIQKKMSQVALSSTKIKLERIRHELEASKRILASTWNGLEPQYEAVIGNLYSISPVPSFEDLQALLLKNPEIARWSTEIEQREATIKFEQANAIPDPFVSGGYRHISERNDNAFVVGLSIPIPILNRNQGAISEARRRLKKAVEEQQNAEAVVNTALAGAFETLSASYEEVMLLEDIVLPEAESAYELIFEGYREGEFPLLNVLVAQKAVFDTKLQYIDALLSYHSSRANVERLIGTPLVDIENYSNNKSALRSSDKTGETK
jgi:cobalt-zinc-cadmium efflux system outer membrane protein